MPEIILILEPDAGRLTAETSAATVQETAQIKNLFGQGTALNCARPAASANKIVETDSNAFDDEPDKKTINLFRIYHCSTVDGPGRRSVIQVAGCSLRCAGCYVPETHDPANGARVSIAWLVEQMNRRRAEHDGVTILGGEPFDQTASLQQLVSKLKANGFHLVIYTGRTLEELLARKCRMTDEVLSKADVLIDGAFVKSLARNAGEYRGSSNQRIVESPLVRKNNS